MQLVNRLAENRVLWLSFTATLLITLAFPVLIRIWDLVLLDGIADPDEARRVIAAMDAQQKMVHAWITATADVAYPLAYGALFVGSARRFFPQIGWLLAVPSMVLVPIDLAEGVVQILALTEVTDWLGAKAFLTSLKQVLFVWGLAVTLCGWIRWSGSRLFG